MKTIELKVAQIGNSRGVRLPVASLRRYHIAGVVLMEERSDGILLRTSGPAASKLSWEDTAREMAANDADWNEWNVTADDGMDQVPWKADKAQRVAERRARYNAKKTPRRKT